MNNKFNFLNLPSDLPGDARRHVPFRSIIHKPLCLIFVFVFVFSIMFSYVHPVAALADPQPEYDPVYNTEIIRLADYVDQELTPDQQDIFYIMFGAYLVAQGAMSEYLIEDPYTTQDGVIGWFKSCGIQIYNSFVVGNSLSAPSVIVQQGLQDLVNSAMGFAIKAGLYQSKVTFIDDVMNSDYYFLPYNQGLQIGINQVLAQNGGLYNWQQYSDVPASFSWNHVELSQAAQTDYQYYSREFSYPSLFNSTVHLVNNSSFGSVLNGLIDFDISIFNQYHNILVDTAHLTYQFYDDNGNVLTDALTFVHRAISASSNGQNIGYGYAQAGRSGGSFSNALTKEQVILNLFNGTLPQFYFNYTYPPAYGNYYETYFSMPAIIMNGADFQFYHGTSWNDKVRFQIISDLDFEENPVPYYLQVQNDYLLDLKGLIQDLINVTVLKPVVFDNIYDDQGNQVQPVTQQVAVSVSLPDSGITLSDDLFHDITKPGSYISYLWFMTKPLVQYTSDFVNTLVFDGDGDFNMTGPGAIVFGVVSLGLIGGLVVKCLL